LIRRSSALNDRIAVGVAVLDGVGLSILSIIDDIFAVADKLLKDWMKQDSYNKISSTKDPAPQWRKL
jgi:hypothetical protein